jgi:hypothetical protein
MGEFPLDISMADFASFEVFTAVKIEVEVFWVVTPFRGCMDL